MSRITGNKVSFTPDIPPEIAKQRIRYEKQVSDDAGQTWSNPQPCELFEAAKPDGSRDFRPEIERARNALPRFNPSFNQEPVKDGEYIISALVGLRTDELWELIFEKYRLLDPMMMCRRRDEISRLFNMMADSRQISKESIPDSVFKRFLGEESMPRRPIRDNPQA